MLRERGLLRAAWYLGVLEEAQLEGLVELEVLAAAAHSGDEDDASLLALELLHRAHLGQGQQVRGQGAPLGGGWRGSLCPWQGGLLSPPAPRTVPSAG